jgi:hypothetical protein
VFAPAFKAFLKRACDIAVVGPVSPMPPSRRMRAHLRAAARRFTLQKATLF